MWKCEHLVSSPLVVLRLSQVWETPKIQHLRHLSPLEFCNPLKSHFALVVSNDDPENGLGLLESGVSCKSARA